MWAQWTVGCSWLLFTATAGVDGSNLHRHIVIIFPQWKVLIDPAEPGDTSSNLNSYFLLLAVYALKAVLGSTRSVGLQTTIFIFGSCLTDNPGFSEVI